MISVNDTRIPLVIIELKKELGEGGCDPTTQAGLSMKRYWIPAERQPIRERCCCPTLMLAGGGPWLGVLGGVFTDRFIVQRLTPMEWFAHSSTKEDGRVYHLTRVLIAFRECIHDLETFYRSEVPKLRALEAGHAHPRFYPFSNTFVDEAGKVFTFQYVRKLESDPACVTYLARIDSPQPIFPDLPTSATPADSCNIVVKFVNRYGTEVHEFLAKRNHAPRLRYCGPIPNSVVQERLPEALKVLPPPGLSLGPMQMVVMDYVPQSKHTPADARSKVKVVLDELHSNGFVFGDLRPQNVLFDESGEVQFIDFDWTGRSNDDKSDGIYARYPLNISQNIPWPEGVKGLSTILPQHDQEMCAKMFF
ncbi:hypothetical protein BD410DRAFT_727414 [Rickenella mellea]|uniref:Protein kinase domain-containing protein n=1 Tax=Rickenella mellea TaxID=50990 RepID=A0A4Y7PXJ2_9AGAM|nr:hypothetical protein BD410DRAFT_727414 [Rickenella mellea]